jgi:hypothetical protein
LAGNGLDGAEQFWACPFYLSLRFVARALRERESGHIRFDDHPVSLPGIRTEPREPNVQKRSRQNEMSPVSKCRKKQPPGTVQQRTEASINLSPTSQQRSLAIPSRQQAIIRYFYTELRIEQFQRTLLSFDDEPPEAGDRVPLRWC